MSYFNPEDILSRAQPLEDWHKELCSNKENPERKLIAEEAEAEATEGYDVKLSLLQSLGATMTTTQTAANTAKKPAFDVKAFLAVANVLANEECHSSSTKTYPCPAWLTLKSGIICEANAFIVTAGIIKSTRGIMDAISFTQRQLDVAVERLTMQELRSGRTTAEVHNFGPDMTKLGQSLAFKGNAHEDNYDIGSNDGEDHGSATRLSGFNPDGQEYDLALIEAAEQVEKLERVLENGENIMCEVIAWIDENATDLNLKVETGHSIKLGPIGNEIRVPRYETLSPSTLIFGVNAQREFIRNNRR